MNLYFETQYQGELFFLAAALGMLCALAMDGCALVLGKALRPIADILSFLMTTAAVLCLSLFVGRQQPRLYLLLGAGCGVTPYALGLRRLLLIVYCRLKRVCAQSSAWLQKKLARRKELAQIRRNV